MGVGVEDVIAVKVLEHGIVPPVPNFRDEDPDLGLLNLSRGGRYPVDYAIHLAAGFGSQIALTLTRRIPGGSERIDRRDVYQRWLDDVTGLDQAETETVLRTLRVVSTGAPSRTPKPATWAWGTAPTRRAPAPPPSVVDRTVVPAMTSVPPSPTLPPLRGEREIRVAPAIATATATATPTPAPGPGPDRDPDPDPDRDPADPDPPDPDRRPRPRPRPDRDRDPTRPRPRPRPAPTPISTDPVTPRVVAIVAEKTGYPPDLLDMDLDLEADLGVDTVKQAETFAAVREEWSIPRIENLRLRDFPTLRHVVGFVRTYRPDLAAAPTLAAPVPPSPTLPPLRGERETLLHPLRSHPSPALPGERAG